MEPATDISTNEQKFKDDVYKMRTLLEEIEKHTLLAHAGNSDRLPEIFKRRFELAERYGWKIYGPHNVVRPPKKFHCFEWGATFCKIPYNNEFVSVPHWFWSDNVIQYGDWIDSASDVSIDVQPNLQ